MLTCITYNCEYADDVRISFLKFLYNQCDFLFVQEHGLYKSQFGWFNKLGINVGVHGVSAMDEGIALKGRPYGGAAIVWNGGINANIKPVKYESTRMCALTVNIADESFLLICVYMPCDDNRPCHNLVEYNTVLNDIKTICNSVDVDHVILGGDFNSNVP